MPTPHGPLDGIVVIDLTRALAGPHAGMMLADLGARVIKVENPDGGDDTRGWGPPFVGPEDDPVATYYLSCNRNKESITLDLKSADGRATLERLVRCSDVLLENFRPGVLDRLGFSVGRLHELNPRLVLLSISGFGHDGPEGARAGYDQIAQGEGGLMSVTGSGPDDPQRVGVPIGDLLAGMYGAFGVLAALLERARTGRGQLVRTSLLAAIVGVHAFQGTRWTVAREVPRAQGNHHPSICPYGLFHCRDGAVQISVGSEGLWRRFCAGFGLDPAAEGLATNPERVRNRERVIKLVEDAFAGYETAELLPRLAALGVPAGKVRSLDEVYDWAQTGSQGLLIDVEHPTLGTIRLPGPPLRFFTDDGEVTRREHAAPPLLGQHDASVRRWLDERDARAGGGGAGLSGRLGAHELLELALDEGSFRSWDTDPFVLSVVSGAEQGTRYAAELAVAREKSGVDEALITGEGRIRGRRVALVAGEFAFLAGSIGMAATERLVRAVERATAEGLPLLAAPASGGTRMQEGTIAFVGMVKIAAAVTRHKQAGLPYLVYLRQPTTGGVLASWGSLGHVTVAEPGALIGFLGPRVYEALYGAPFPEGVQVAENLFEHGLLDGIVRPERVAEIADRALNVLLAPREGLPDVPPLPTEPLADVPAWESITRSRNPARPGVRRLLRIAARDVLPLNGTGEGEADPGLLLALARFGSAPAVVLGQDRTRQSSQSPLGPAGLREARRGIRLAHELGLPLVTVIDTPGAALSRQAEEGGLAGEIARCLADLTVLRAPTVCVLLGQGTGGGALALLPADRVVAAQHGWLSPLPPEGASAILHRTTERAPDMAAAQGVRSLDLLRHGIVDRIVAERPDAADEPEQFCRRLGQVLEHELVELLRRPQDLRLAERHQRHRRLGLPAG